MDSDGKERARLEGYYPREDFRARLEMALGRLAFNKKQFDEAARRYGSVVDTYGKSKAAPEALYWKHVSEYSKTHDPSHLQKAAGELKQRYPDSEWTTKASVWGGSAA